MSFQKRHIGPSEKETLGMLSSIGFKNLDELSQSALPESIQTKSKLKLRDAQDESEALEAFKKLMSQNKVYRSYIGMGYYNCITPSVIKRNIFENPGWYTQYTPYQAEISQGRLEALLNFQTMIGDLTGLPISNASLLDEATAAAEAMGLCFNSRKNNSANRFYVSDTCHPQTIGVVQTRAEPLNIKVEVCSPEQMKFNLEDVFGVLLQYPNTNGIIEDYQKIISEAHDASALVVLATDLLALTLLPSPGELGADVAVGSSQRFGVPLGFGGPHAGFFATKEEFTRKVPGRLVGVSKDKNGRSAIRLALQTREQHIRREKATSNICTAQVLLAIMASMYAVYHGPKGLKEIAERTHRLTRLLKEKLIELGYFLSEGEFFDTLKVMVSAEDKAEIIQNSHAKEINFRVDYVDAIGISLDETTRLKDLEDILSCFNLKNKAEVSVSEPSGSVTHGFKRKSEYLTHPTFSRYHSESEMMRYIKRLETKDLSLTTSMIPLGSCTMKLNAATEMYPVSWPEVGGLHPFAPEDQTKGYLQLFSELENDLAEITGFDSVSLQPNSGAQGEYAGLLAIRAYHRDLKQEQRNVCLIPQSAHGTNPASAALVGMKVVVVKCDSSGNIDVVDLQNKAKQHAQTLAALMVTYPSTHGVFENPIREICQIIHDHGGQVYMDGANLNAQLGLCKPGEFGPDVAHLNLHKTFCIPHGGGGPGMGPIAVKKHLAPYLPCHPVVKMGGEKAFGVISAAPWGSPSILPISYLYIRMMGEAGLKASAQVAILNANYIAKKLDPYFPVLYKGNKGLVAHECIVDIRPIKKDKGVDVEDVAKRLMDYGYHAPTISFPVAGTMMIEPTESEGKEELDRFCEAMIQIRKEIDETPEIVKNAPHSSYDLVQENWDYSYSRQKAAFPVSRLKEHKYWPPVSRIDNVHGDRNLVCSCPTTEEWMN